MTTWTEKYRPIYFEDIRGQEEAVAKIKEFIKNEKGKCGLANEYYYNLIKNGRDNQC